MKKLLLAVALGATILPACKKASSTGTIQLINNSNNPYIVYINGAQYTTQQGRTSTSVTKDAGPYVVRVLQQSGYIFYPTDQQYNVTVSAGNTEVVSYP